MSPGGVDGWFFRGGNATPRGIWWLVENASLSTADKRGVVRHIVCKQPGSNCVDSGPGGGSTRAAVAPEA